MALFAAESGKELEITGNEWALCIIRAMAITETGVWRSPKPDHADHPNRGMAITLR
jgi:hypothetical protein